MKEVSSQFFNIQCFYSFNIYVSPFSYGKSFDGPFWKSDLLSCCEHFVLHTLLLTGARGLSCVSYL